MNLRHLTDETLLADAKVAAQRERDALSIVLHHLREVDRRRLYCALKYQGITEYAIKELKYSEDQAWSRVSAMKLLKELPAIESKINDGTLSLTNLGLARKAFAQEAKLAKVEKRNEPKRTAEQKMAIIEKIENLSKRDAEKVLRFETGIVATSSESTRVLSDGSIEMKVIVDKETAALAERLKGLLAHSHPGITNGQLMKLALEALADKKDPLKKAERAAVRPVPERKVPATNPRYIPATVRHQVWLRDGGCCTNCGSMRAVQHEHVIPVALGGKGTLENVKLLCRACNQRSAITAYGERKVSHFVQAPRSEYLTSA